jgi:outer membrane murein-binding lipoprotein Lpp
MNRDLIYLTLLLLLTALSGNCFADEMESRQQISDNSGLTISLQQVNHPLLLLELQQLQQELWHQQINLLTQVTNMSFGAVDAIITIVLPGGLLYAFNKKMKQQQAKNNLHELNSELLQLQVDIKQMRLAQL